VQFPTKFEMVVNRKTAIGGIVACHRSIVQQQCWSA
jgi:hypothetical protein